MSFPRYPEYKDSGVDWLGEVPSHWVLEKIKYIASFMGGGTPSREEPTFWNGDVPWVSPKDMKSERVTSPEECITEEGLANSAAGMVPSGAALLVVRSGILRHTLPVAINSAPVAMNQDMKALIFQPDKCLSDFFMRWVQGLNDRLLLAWAKQGATVESIDHDYLANARFPLPPISEQSAIAAFLDRETGKIDALVAEQEKLIELLKEKREAVISRAVTKGLDPTVPMKDSGVEWLGEVPEHWEVRKLSTVIDKITNGYVGPTRDVLVEHGVRYLQSLHVKGNLIKFDTPYYVSEEWSLAHSKSILDAGDVLIVQTGEIGQAAVVTQEFAGCNCHALIVVSPIRSVLSGEWLSWVLNSAYGFHSLLSIQTGALHPHLNCGNVRDLFIPLPPSTDQLEIIADLLNRLDAFDGLVTEAQHAIDLLKERRSALISAAVTGKIDVRSLSADVIPFTPRQRRNLVAAEVIRRCCNDNTFGRTKAQKLFYLLDVHLGIEEFDGRYQRWIAGPFDSAMMTSVASDLENAGWFKEVGIDERYFYRPLANAGEVGGAFSRAWGQRAKEITRLIDLLRPLETKKCEVIATLYAAWNDFLLRGEPVDDTKLLREVRTNWHESKKNISEADWNEGLRWMRKHEVVPKGTGRPTIQQMSLGL